MAFDAHGAYLGSTTAPMQGFQIAPTNTGPQAGQKNYVFVDEHNRHKRLKVMRACEGCRRRKIKCDAATTNTWPCSACRRLKLHCQPPSINQDGTGTGQLTDSDTEYSQSSISGLDPSGPHLDGQQHYGAIPPGQYAGNQQYPSPMAPYQLQQFNEHPESQPQMYQQMQPQSQSQITSFPQPQQTPAHSQPYSAYSPPRIRTASSGSPLDLGDQAAEGLTESLGDLRIDETGIAPYVRKAKGVGNEPDGPVQDFEAEIKLPPLSTGAGSQIRIPPALMPSEEEAAQYFQLFFDDIHPYVPVINRAHFMHQWQNERNSISPLLLEGLFACAGRLSDDPAQGAQWLALAARHEDSFLDHPRLSTLQGLILLLKAREAAPKRGYFYKSWMTVKTAVSMAKSLDLDEHLSEHENGGSCDSNPIDCLTKTRIWQTLMILEVMIGGPQGRHDFGVDLETVDMSFNPPSSNMTPYEAELSRQFGCWARNVMNIGKVATAYIKLRKQKDWYANPKFIANNVAFRKWPEEVPDDLQISFPQDGTAPYLPTHFLGNMHSHYHLGVIMLQRPQLLSSKAVGPDIHWRNTFSTCYSSAKYLCRLQEAVLARYGMSGLLVMQRGINFTIYGVLTCTMLHLVAITSPYSEFNEDARDYFTRHMRILEQCTSAWPMPDLQEQVNGLRMAFSADINRPFQLKPTFPYASPGSEGGYQPSPPMDIHPYPPHLQRDNTYEQQAQLHFQSLTPPISAGPQDSKNGSPHLQQSMGMYSQPTSAPMSQEQVNWNPSRLITQWDSAFAIPPSALAPPSSGNSPPMNMAMSSTTPTMSQQQAPYTSPYSQSTGMTPIATPQSMSQASYGPAPVFVSPRDWQQSVAHAFDPEGLKRRWDAR